MNRVNRLNAIIEMYEGVTPTDALNELSTLVVAQILEIAGLSKGEERLLVLELLVGNFSKFLQRKITFVEDVEDKLK